MTSPDAHALAETFAGADPDRPPQVPPSEPYGPQGADEDPADPTAVAEDPAALLSTVSPAEAPNPTVACNAAKALLSSFILTRRGPTGRKGGCAKSLRTFSGPP